VKSVEEQSGARDDTTSHRE